MRQPCGNGDKVYEISIYNREVRDLVKDNKSHSLLDDEWADAHVHDVVACDEAAARAAISKRFPPDEGFVIVSVVLTPEASTRIGF